MYVLKVDLLLQAKPLLLVRQGKRTTLSLEHLVGVPGIIYSGISRFLYRYKQFLYIRAVI
jgi:hypothetical protein